MTRATTKWRAPGSQKAAFVRGIPKADVVLKDVPIERETDKAILIRVKDQPEPIWIPLSQVRKIDRPETGPATITVSAWIAEKKGLA